MKDPIRPDILRTALDEADALIEELEHVDAALGVYLVRCLGESSGRAGEGPAVGSAVWYRARILEWCRAPSVCSEIAREAIESTRMAVPELTDEELRLLVTDLVERKVGRADAAPRALADRPLARPAPTSVESPGQSPPLRRER